MPVSAGENLCDCLRRIAVLLEQGKPVEAATIVAEIEELLPRLPPKMPEDQLAEARTLLARCGVLEQTMRQSVVASLQRLAATRRSSIYRR
jgi:hypothetical protein